MKPYPYLRAYLAGIAAPTALMPLVLLILVLVRFTDHVHSPIERLVVFPMAIVPNCWGLYNMGYLALRSRRELSLGLYGAALPFLLAPLGYLLQVTLGIVIWLPTTFAVGFPLAVILYYLVWKYVVGFLNDALGIG